MNNRIIKAALGSFLLLLVGSNFAFSQSFWEPVTNITGYVSTEVNYFGEFETDDLNYGASISEAGILITHRPKSNMTLKGVVVYHPEFSFDQMLNEAYGSVTANEFLTFKVGRFLLPLSPMNTYYYAPVNQSATLPIVVSNHEFFPLGTDGVSLSGGTGEDFRLNYEVFAGGYRQTTWLKTGALGFFGSEVSYFSTIENDPIAIDQSFNNQYDLGFGGTIGFRFREFAKVGVSYFKQKDTTIPLGVTLPENALYAGSPETYLVQVYNYDKSAVGINGTFKYGNTTLTGEYWDGNLDVGGPVDLEGKFVILSHTIDKFTPYVRYETQKTARIDYSRYTAGVNFKPSFERTMKLEYVYYDQQSGTVGGFIGTMIFSF